MGIRIKAQKYIIAPLLIIITFLMPNSINGIPSSRYEAISVILLLLIAITMFAVNRLDTVALALSMVSLIVLTIATEIALSKQTGNLKFGYARLLYILIYLLIINQLIEVKIDYNYAETILDYVLVSIVIINLVSFLNIGSINTFLSNRYTQYMSYITDYHLGIKKPIMTFGVHNIASFIYMGLFLLSRSWYLKSGNKKHLLYCVILFLYLILLRCSTSLAYCMLCLLIIAHDYSSSTSQILIVAAILAVLWVIALRLGLISLYTEIAQSQSNGILSRYFEGMQGLFARNTSVLDDCPLGTGFCIATNDESIYGADSGLVIVHTIGNYFFTITFYYLLVRYISRTFKNNLISIVLYLFIMELGFITFFYYRTVSFIILLILLSNPVETNR